MYASSSLDARRVTYKIIFSFVSNSSLSGGHSIKKLPQKFRSCAHRRERGLASIHRFIAAIVEGVESSIQNVGNVVKCMSKLVIITAVETREFTQFACNLCIKAFAN